MFCERIRSDHYSIAMQDDAALECSEVERAQLDYQMFVKSAVMTAEAATLELLR